MTSQSGNRVERMAEPQRTRPPTPRVRRLVIYIVKASGCENYQQETNTSRQPRETGSTISSLRQTLETEENVLLRASVAIGERLHQDAGVSLSCEAVAQGHVLGLCAAGFAKSRCQPSWTTFREASIGRRPLHSGAGESSLGVSGPTAAG